MSNAARVLTGVRWSSAVLCPRMAVFQGLKAPHGVHDEVTLRRFKRGNAWGRIVREEIVGNLRRRGYRPVSEMEILWPAKAPIGIGHADVYVPAHRRIVEVFSTDGTGYPPQKGIQAAGYALNHPRATEAVVLVVDRVTGDDRTYDVDLDALEPQVRDIERQVVDALHGGELPERVTYAPWAWPCSECVFTEHCWADWEPVPLAQIPGAVDDAARLADAEDAVSAARRDVKALEQARAAIRDRLRPLTPAGETVAAGEISLRRTEVAGRVTFALGDYQAAGHRLPRRARAFISEGAGSERWTVKRTPEEATS
jgi:hypothetical protein